MPPIRIPRNFKRVLDKKSGTPMHAAIQECVQRLADNPRHPGLHAHRMGGTHGVWEAYVDGGNRVTYEWDNGTIVLRNNCNHDMLKRRP